MNPTTEALLAPLPIRIVTLLGIIGCVIGLIASILVTFLGAGSIISVLSLIAMAAYVLNLVSLIGLRRMKKWAFYLFALGTLVSLLKLLGHHTTSDLTSAVISVVFFVYLWSLRNRFV